MHDLLEFVGLGLACLLGVAVVVAGWEHLVREAAASAPAPDARRPHPGLGDEPPAVERGPRAAMAAAISRAAGRGPHEGTAWMDTCPLVTVGSPGGDPADDAAAGAAGAEGARATPGAHDRHEASAGPAAASADSPLDLAIPPAATAQEVPAAPEERCPSPLPPARQAAADAPKPQVPASVSAVAAPTAPRPASTAGLDPPQGTHMRHLRADTAVIDVEPPPPAPVPTPLPATAAAAPPAALAAAPVAALPAAAAPEATPGAAPPAAAGTGGALAAGARISTIERALLR